MYCAGLEMVALHETNRALRSFVHDVRDNMDEYTGIIYFQQQRKLDGVGAKPALHGCWNFNMGTHIYWGKLPPKYTRIIMQLIDSDKLQVLKKARRPEIKSNKNHSIDITVSRDPRGVEWRHVTYPKIFIGGYFGIQWPKLTKFVNITDAVSRITLKSCWWTYSPETRYKLTSALILSSVPIVCGNLNHGLNRIKNGTWHSAYVDIFQSRAST